MAPFRSSDISAGQTVVRSACGCLLAIALLVGCERPATREELGTVIFDAAKLPGAGTPYERPEMKLPTPKAPPAENPVKIEVPTLENVLPGAIDEQPEQPIP